MRLSRSKIWLKKLLRKSRNISGSPAPSHTKDNQEVNITKLAGFVSNIKIVVGAIVLLLSLLSKDAGKVTHTINLVNACESVSSPVNDQAHNPVGE